MTPFLKHQSDEMMQQIAVGQRACRRPWPLTKRYVYVILRPQALARTTLWLCEFARRGPPAR